MDPRALLDQPLIAQRYFFPRPDPPRAPWTVEVEGASLACARTASTDGPALLHFHGNGEVVRDWADLAAALHGEGLEVIRAEYRGYGGSTGAPALATLLDDALAVYDAAALDGARTVVYGRSVGSLYALHVAAHRRVAGLILESGVADLHERITLRVQPGELDVDAAALTAAIDALFDHRAKVEAYGGPVLLLHARGDSLVSVRHAERFAEWAGERAELERYLRGDHNTLHAFHGDDLRARVVDFARRVTGR
jgi:uncharacterized protein